MMIVAGNGSLMNSLVRTHEDPTAEWKALWFTTDGWVPNNARLPVLHYRQAFPDAVADGAQTLESLFNGNGWTPQWRNGVYPFHHYHSNAHEVLGIADGHARVLLGGPHGAVVTLAKGDCVLLPAGTGHCLLKASPDFLVVGAYPPGQDWDLRRDALSDAERATMAALPAPATDPVAGNGGPVLTLWAGPV